MTFFVCVAFSCSFDLSLANLQDRIREYFEKINVAENPPASTHKTTSSTSTPLQIFTFMFCFLFLFFPCFFSSERTELDKAAATRFIKHAIQQAQWKKTAAEADDDEDDNNATSDNTHQAIPSSLSSHIPVKMTSKMIQRAAYEKEIKEQDAMDSDDEDELGVFEGDELPTRTESKQDIKGKGKRKEPTPLAIVDEDAHINLNKKRRPAIDPFAGTFDFILPSGLALLIMMIYRIRR